MAKNVTGGLDRGCIVSIDTRSGSDADEEGSRAPPPRWDRTAERGEGKDDAVWLG